MKIQFTRNLLHVRTFNWKGANNETTLNETSVNWKATNFEVEQRYNAPIRRETLQKVDRNLMKSCALHDAWDRDNNHGDDWTQQWDTAQQWVATIAPPCDVIAILCTQQWRAVRMENRFSFAVHLFSLFSVCYLIVAKIFQNTPGNQIITRIKEGVISLQFKMKFWF